MLYQEELNPTILENVQLQEGGRKRKRKGTKRKTAKKAGKRRKSKKSKKAKKSRKH